MPAMDERPSVTPLLFYRDPRAALAFLERAFGFETRLVVDDGQGGVIHSETWFGDGQVMVSGPPFELWASPADVGGRRTGSVHLQMKDGIDAHYARAQAAGAIIDREIADQAYGDRTYSCRDLEGHAWSFGQTLQQMSPDEAAEATGHKVTTSL
jgi:uncharacterized glyoxalase superfamily protein PhnB